MSLQEIRDYARLHLDIDEEDTPDLLLDVWAREGFNRVARAEDEYSFYSIVVPFTTVAAQQAYDLTTIAGGTPASIVAKVKDVRGDSWALSPADHRQMREHYRSTSPTSGTPRHFSQFGTDLYLWPTPGGESALELTGYRRPYDWVAQGAAATPDLPDEFHDMIAMWVLHRLYAQQDDPEMANHYREYFAGSFSTLRREYTRGLVAQPLIMNGGTRSGGFPSSRLLYDFEA